MDKRQVSSDRTAAVKAREREIDTVSEEIVRIFLAGMVADYLSLSVEKGK
jgi:hypothetical protein